jgi:hypothetical protein
MIWLNSRKIETRITNNQLSDKEGFFYLYATLIYFFVFKLINGAIHDSCYFIIAYSSASFFVLIGLPLIYKLNKSVDDKDFIKRFFAITWIIKIKLTLVNLVFALISMGLFPVHDKSETRKYLVNIYYSIMILIYFILTYRSFKRLKKQGV